MPKYTNEEIEKINNDFAYKLKAGEKVTLKVEIEIDVTPPKECGWEGLNKYVVQAIKEHPNLGWAIANIELSFYQD